MNIQKDKPRSAFTLVELITVVVILAIAALLAIPMFSNAADSQLQTAAAMVAADIDYTKSMAITHQQNYRIVFDKANNEYEVQDNTGTAITHPMKPGKNFTVTFNQDPRLNMVDLQDADFDSQTTITFDYLGSPYSGAGTSNPMNSGEVVLEADGQTLTILVEAVTGYVTIQ